MAILTITDDPPRIERDPARIAQRLGAVGITYQVWGTGRLPKELRGRDLDEAGKRALLDAFDDDIARLSGEHGYTVADVVTLYPDTPGLDADLARFARAHHHSDDEVRFVVQGRGVFALFPAAAPAMEIELHPGDFILLPRGFRHLFRLCEDRRITAIRLFTDPAGWVAHYD